MNRGKKEKALQEARELLVELVERRHPEPTRGVKELKEKLKVARRRPSAIGMSYIKIEALALVPQAA